MRLLHIDRVLILDTLLVEHLKSALSNRRGDDGRQLEVVSHAPSYDFDRMQSIFPPLTRPNSPRKKWFPRTACFPRGARPGLITAPRLAQLPDYPDQWELTQIATVDMHR
jgi:hypothetical protein